MGRPADPAHRVEDDHRAAGPETARRIALAQLAIGVPALTIVLFGLVLGFLLSERDLGITFWGVAVPVVVAFAVYLGRAIVALRRASRAVAAAGTAESEEG